MESLQSSIEQLNSLFQDRMKAFENKLHNNSGTAPSTVGLAAEFSSFREFITEALKSLQLQVQILASNMDQLEMQSRRKVLLLHGVPEEKNEDLMQTVVSIIQSKIKVDHFSAADVKRCHRMGRPATPHKHRPIYIKFGEISVRDKVWFQKTKLKGSGSTLSEFLTKTRHEVFMAAREKYGVAKCWTKAGIIYVAGADGKRHRVNSLGDVCNKSSALNSSKLEPPAAKTEQKTKRAAATRR